MNLYGPKNPSFQQALDPCDTRYVDDGDFPANRLANCTADGIDTTDFRSFVAGGTVLHLEEIQTCLMKMEKQLHTV